MCFFSPSFFLCRTCSEAYIPQLDLWLISGTLHTVQVLDFYRGPLFCVHLSLQNSSSLFFGKVVDILHCIPPSCLFFCPCIWKYAFGSTLKTRQTALEGSQVVGTTLVWLQEELRAPVTADHRDRPNEILTEPLVFNQIKAAWAALVGATWRVSPARRRGPLGLQKSLKSESQTVKWKPPTGTAGVPQAKQSTRLITEPGSHSRDGSQRLRGWKHKGQGRSRNPWKTFKGLHSQPSSKEFCLYF